MNKVYQIIWNSVLQCFVVTSEFAKNKGKAASKVVAVVALSSVVSMVHAQTTDSSGSVTSVKSPVTTHNDIASPELTSLPDIPFTSDMLSRNRMTRGLGGSASRGVSTFADPGVEDSDPVIVSQFRPVVDALGGKAKMDIMGNITGPKYQLQQIDQATGGHGDASNPFTSVGDALDSLSNSLANLSDSALRYVDSTSKTSISLLGGKDEDGKTGTIISNLKSGEVSVGSSQAINGSQLFITNKNMTEYLGGDADINSKGDWTAPTYSVQNRTAHNVGDALTVLDAGISKNTKNIDGLTSNITNLNNTINSGNLGLVKRDATTNNLTVDAAGTGDRVSFSGADEKKRTLDGLENAAINEKSAEAVNGSQLYKANNDIAKSLGGNASVDAAGNLVAPGYKIQNKTLNSVGDALGALDTGVTTNTNNITDLANNVSNLTSDISKGNIGLVKRDATTNNITVDADGEGNSVSLSGKNGVRTLDGLKDAILDENSTQAVNGSQLFTTNNKVAQNNSNINEMANSLGGGAKVSDDGKFVAPNYTVQNKTVNTVGEALDALNEGVGGLTSGINDGSVGLVKQNATSHDITVAAATGGNSVSIAGTEGERTLKGLKDAALDDKSTEAVNGKQLFATNQNVQKNNSNINNIAKNLGGDAAVDKDGNFVAPEYTVQGQKNNNVGDAITGLDNGITKNAGDISTLTNHINNGSIGLVRQADSNSNITVAALTAGSSVSFMGTAGSRRLTDVSKGLSDEDAVNISQLKDLLSEFGPNSGIDSTTGKVTGPTYRINGKDLNLSGSLADLDNRIGELGSSTGNTDHLIAYDDKEHKSVTLGGKDSNSSVSLGNVADGKVEKDSKDAVNGGQLHEVKNQVAQNTNDINDMKNNVDGITNGTAGLVQQDSQTNDITVGKDKGGDKVSLANNAGKDRVLSGVANGIADNDAATIAQVKDLANASTSSTLASNNTSKREKPIASGKDSIALGAGAQSSADNSIALGSNSKASGNNSVALGNDSFADRANSVSIGSVGKERQLTNVGRGTAGTDAVNLNQLNEGLAGLSNSTNQHFRDIDKNINHLKNQLRGGIASAMAMGSLPQPYSAGSGMMSMGGATFHGESAMAIGASKISEDGRWVTKLQGSTNTQGDFGVSAGVGYQW